MAHLQANEQAALQAASNLNADIDDWDVTDVGGTHQRIGGSFATSRAALMDSVKSTVPMDGGGVMGAAVGAGSSSMVAKGRHLSRIEPELLAILHEINEKRLTENQRNATVTIDELENAPAEPVE
jgi:hypothetical protein